MFQPYGIVPSVDIVIYHTCLNISHSYNSQRNRVLPQEDLEAALAAGEAALGGDRPGGGGDAASAGALLRLLPALRRAPEAPLRALLDRTDRSGRPPCGACECGEAERTPTRHDTGRLPALLRLLALAGTEAAHRAASELLQLRASPSPAAAEAYLAALALAPDVAPEVARDVLQLAGEARSPPVAAAALLAAAAVAAPDDAPRVAALLLDQLERCKVRAGERRVVSSTKTRPGPRRSRTRAPTVLDRGRFAGRRIDDRFFLWCARGSTLLLIKIDDSGSTAEGPRVF